MLRELTDLLSNAFLWMLLGAGAAALIWLKLRRRRKALRQSGILGTQLRDVGELAVEEARITLVHCTREPRRFFGKELPLVRERMIFTIDAVIRIGFDLSQVEANVSEMRKAITLRLPPVRILSGAMDYGSMKVLDEKTGMFARPRLESHREAMLDLLREAEEKARGYGALEQAQANARAQLRAFVDKFYDLTEYSLEILIPAQPDQPGQ